MAKTTTTKKTKFSSLKKAITTSKHIWPSWKLRRVNRSSDPHVSVLNRVVFRVLSVVEVIVLISTLCFFYLCCGCHF